MGKEENLPSQLNADYYRRKNISAAESVKAVVGMEPSPLRPPPGPPLATAVPMALAPPPTPPPHSPPPPTQQHGAFRRLATRAKNVAGKSLRFGGNVGGLAATFYLALHWYESNQVDQFFGTAAVAADGDESSKLSERKKRVLVLPFDNLKVVERRRSGDIQSSSESLQRLLGQGKQPTIVIEAKELVEIIRGAAADPNVSALYADFGEGMRYPMGYAHAEEIRDAVRVFNESHRVHRDPNVGHNSVFAMGRNSNPRPTYAFGHSFNWNEYFLASAFSYVHIQTRGDLNLFGCATTNTFLRGALDKYGIKAHVFRHGEYKNAPSALINKKYSKAHLETVKSMTSSLNGTIRSCIESSRPLNFDDVMWKSIFDYGTLTSENSKEIGLVDFAPPVNPLESLLHFYKEEQNKNLKKKTTKNFVSSRAGEKDDAKKIDSTKEGGIVAKIECGEEEADAPRKKMEAKLGLHESFGKFAATQAVPLTMYKHMLNKKAKLERKHEWFDNILRRMSESSIATSAILSLLGYEPGNAPSKCEKVAIVTVEGNIGTPLSFEIVHSLRQIRKDKNVKCVVLRVDSPGGSVVSSEAILEEIKLFDKPVICSMSNAAASGGYYIAMNSEKIFAQPTTLTGSIGVFGVKIDASEWAKSYGIRGDYYPHGSHAAAMHPLAPLTPGMKENIARTVLDYYDYFKSIVAARRSLSAEEVEEVARGRVWTGEQAKEVGLVDALGGLDRAISYAKMAHMSRTARVEVEHWPKRSASLKDLMKLLVGGQSSVVGFGQALLAVTMELGGDAESASMEQFLKRLVELKFSEKPHFMLTMDEKTAIELIMSGE